MKITKPLYTAAGELIPISFKQFLDRIPVERNCREIDGKVRIHTFTGYGPVGGIDLWEQFGPDTVGALDSTFIQRDIPLGNKEQLRQSLIDQAIKGMVFYKPLPELMEDMALIHINQHGNPDCIVRIGDRRWMMANANDFKLFEKNDRYAIGCMQASRTLILDIKKKDYANKLTNSIDQVIDNIKEKEDDPKRATRENIKTPGGARG